MKSRHLIPLLSLLILTSFTPPRNSYYLQGRVKVKDEKVSLIGSASSVSFYFKGQDCSVTLQSVDSKDHQNYVAVEVDGTYTMRLKIEKGPEQAYSIPIASTATIHKVTLYKATEAANGNVVFSGTSVATLNQDAGIKTRKKIEFIGDSITCGMGNDVSAVPCYTGDWFDQHNAYWSFGPITARTLDAEFMLSSVSGIGMYRNWNDEHDKEPIMPEVYENLYLNKNASIPYDFSFQPDVVVICLGTNDLSDGDRKKQRLAFDAAQFIAGYEAFIAMLYKHYPKVKLVLLNSPMVSGERNTTLVNCLKKIQKDISADAARNISIFEFRPMVTKGCGAHPSIEDDKVMAAQLAPFLKEML